MPVPASFDEGEAVLKTLEVKNFTAFPKARLDFARGLNVIIGENGTGKTHLLKLPYAVMAVSAEEGRKRNGRQPIKAFLQARLAEKLVNVFRPEGRLGRLARRHKGRSRCDVDLRFSESGTSLAFNFLITYQAQPNCGHETPSTSMARRRPRIDVRAAGNVVAWPPEPRFPAAGSRKLSLIRNQVQLCFTE